MTPARFADGRVAFAVGDIHGRADLLSEMLDKLTAEVAAAPREGGDPVVVFLGDYVDRGPESAAVIDLLLNWAPPGCERRFLKGNHDQSMLAFLTAPVTNRAWLLHGGMETLASYGVEPPWPRAPEADLKTAAEALQANLPPAHVDFLSHLERYAEYGDHLFVHAGVDPDKPLEHQTDRDLFWIRDRFTKGRRAYSHLVVHGHTITDEPLANERRVAVDTGAYASGLLTAARFEDDGVSFLFAGAPARRRSAAAKPEAEARPARHGTMNIDEQKAAFSGFVTATIWTSAYLAQALTFLVLAFATGAGWGVGWAASIAVGIAAGVLFKLNSIWWALLVVLGTILGLGGLTVSALLDMAS